MSATSQDVFARLTGELPLADDPWEYFDSDGDWPQAAVLVGITDEPEPAVLLGRRAEHLPLHPGEIAFAGGKREPEDRSPWDTACREAHEEVGLRKEHIDVIGELPPLITRTGFRVFPCVARIPREFGMVVDPGEFDSVFFTALSVFGDPEVFRLERINYGTQTRMVPHYQIGDDNVWGVTAAVLVLLANVAYDAGFDLQRDWKLDP